MAYKALYRTYRPTRFDEVVGQKHIIQVLKNAVSEDRISHAYVFSGLRGIGKTTIARIFAKAVNCEFGGDGEPCNDCPNCKAVINEETTDVVELDAASNNGVEQMREILEKVNFLPSSLKKKVYIIDEAHMLSTAAFNALLKTLEEPPAHVIFILATTEPYKIPSTILSRCQRLDFKQLTTDEILEMLALVAKKESINITDDALIAIAEASEGGMRDALSILDQARVYNYSQISLDDINSITGRVAQDNLVELIKSLNYKDLEDAIEKVNSLIESGKEVNRILTSLIQFCRDLLLYKNLKENGTSPYVYRKEEFVTLANEISEKKLFYFVDMFVDIQNKIRFTNSPKIYLEVGIIKIVNNASIDLDVLSKIKKLEEKIDILQPNSGVNGLNETTNRLDIIENKIKKLNQEIEKLNVKEFKESVLVKFNTLEDVVLKSKNEPLKLEEQIQDLSDAIKELQQNPTTVVQEGVVQNTQVDEKIKAIEEQISNIKLSEEVENRIKALEEKAQTEVIVQSNNDELNQKVVSISGEIENIKALLIAKPVVDKKEPIISNNTNLEEKVSVVEEYLDMVISRVDELARTIKQTQYSVGTNNYSTDDTTEIAQLNENYLTLLTHIQGLQEKLELTTESIKSEELDALKLELNEKMNLLIGDISSKVSADIEVLNKQIEVLSQKDTSEFESLIAENKQTIQEVKEYSIKLSSKVQEVQDKLKEIQTKMDGGFTKRRSPFEVVREDDEKVEEKKVVIEEEKPKVISTETTVVIKEKPVNQQTEPIKVDETSKIYDAKIVERILHQARDQKCREEKIAILSNWSKLEDRVGHLLAPTAKLLSEGTLTANGYNELLIVYPHASMCNHLMEPKGHTNALQILKITFGKDYDFIALPENTWQEKRMEYAGQYNIGIKYPRLTPIKNPELKIVVVNSSNLTSKKNQLVHQAKSFFGDEIVEQEEE